MADLSEAIPLQRAYRAFTEGHHYAAEVAVRKILAADKRNVGAMRLLGALCVKSNRVEEAETLFKRCIRRQPRDHRLYFELGRAQTQRGHYEAAIKTLDKALAIAPGYSHAIATKADVLERQGRIDDSRAFLDEHAGKGLNASMAAVYSRLEQADKNWQRSIDIAVPFVKRCRDKMTLRVLLTQIARAEEKLENYDRAFEAYRMANSVEPSPFDPVAYRNHVDELIGAFSSENMAALPRASCPSEMPVFLVCMPRSGSTLLDQILHSHPDAYGAGEIPNLMDIVNSLPDETGGYQTYPACIADLTTPILDRLGADYARQVQALAPTAKRIANKHLGNHNLVGVSSLLFPKSRVITLKRNPMDNCFSCYMALLQAHAVPYASDLRALGFAYRQFERMVDHWTAVLDVPVLNIEYEKLVDDPDTWIRTIIEFCGLPWDDRCLRPHEAERAVLTLSYQQVKNPIYKTAVKRYEHYREFLGPLEEALASDDWIERDDLGDGQG